MPAPPGTVEPTQHAPAGVAPDCRGQDFFALDSGLRGLLELYMDDALRAHMWPHLQRLGALAGGRLDELATLADRHPPVLHARDRYGRDEAWIEYHPAYREMERIAFEDFALHAMSHRGGVLDWPDPVPPIAKYALQYLFVQAEFGLMCPISLTDTCAFLLARYGDAALKARFLEPMLRQDRARMLTGAQFMTEKDGGSDVGRLETVAVREGDRWRLHGEKWFCSHTDADLAMVLARPEGAAAGTRGLGLFLMPRLLDDGTRNAYRMLRLKDKLGTRSMASGEIRLEGAIAYVVGDLQSGLRQMLDQVNLSRLSHGVRAAAMMRRCWHEALFAARGRHAFGRDVVDFPLMRRQLMKILLPTEQALSMVCFAAAVMPEAHRGDAQAAASLRLVTALLKLRACRDNVRVATAAMEVRGGNGYIEDWVAPRLVRDAQVGLLWEGTSNINALDAIQRAVGRDRAHEALADTLHTMLEDAPELPAALRATLDAALRRALRQAERVASAAQEESLARAAASALYDAASAVLLAWEGAALGARHGDARRVLLARMVLEHRLSPRDPLDVQRAPGEDAAVHALLRDEAIAPAAASALLAMRAADIA
jgi:alkylation response protein AidB-like acyl-CoA dehydrogenase